LIRKSTGVESDPSSSDPSESSSSLSSDSSESSANDADGNGTGRLPSTPAAPKRRSSHQTSGKGKSRKITKPIPPTKYAGTADPFLYLRFIREGTAYVLMGKVPADQQIFILSYSLTGKAADFYNHKVVKNEVEWTL
jgi:hypothetical protein